MRADSLYRQGEQLLRESSTIEALGKYQQALEYWNHPQIRYRMAQVMYDLGRRVQAYEHVNQALHHGERALGSKFYREALRYKKQLEAELAWWTIICDEPGVDISVGGNHVLEGPGTVTMVLAPGSHSLVANKAGYLTITRSIRLSPAERASSRVELVALEQATATIARWPRWKTWGLTGTGASLTVAGAVLLFKARTDFATYDRILGAECATGCDGNELPAGAEQHRARAVWETWLGAGAVVVGSVVLSSGITLLLLNEERPLYPEYVGRDDPASATRIVPRLSPREIGITTNWQF